MSTFRHLQILSGTNPDAGLTAIYPALRFHASSQGEFKCMKFVSNCGFVWFINFDIGNLYLQNICSFQQAVDKLPGRFA